MAIASRAKPESGKERGAGRLHRALAVVEAHAEPVAKARAIKTALSLVRQTELGDRRLEGLLLVQFGQALSDAPPGRQAFALRRRAVSSIEAGLVLLTSPQWREERAHAQIVLANALLAHASGAHDIERARYLYERALSAFTQRANAEDWALANLNLGSCYCQRTKGGRDANLGRAIAAFSCALRVYTRQRSPADWIRAQLNKAVALSEFVGPERLVNQDAAIRTVSATLRGCSRRALPREWAKCQNLLGSLYYERAAGDRGDNIELAILALRRALSVRTPTDDVYEWRASVSNLAIAFSERIRGRRGKNLENALNLLDQAALSAPRGSFEWGKAQIKRAAILFDRVEGRRSSNLERALGAARAALGVFDCERTPREWANAAIVAANALSERARDGRHGDIEDAIAMLEEVRHRLAGASFSVERATASLNLGAAYTMRVAGSRADNLERAIACCRQALKVFTRQTAPLDWASLHANLSGCYFQRARGDRRMNLERALEASGAALSVLTRATHPVAWAGAKLNLANIYRDRLVGARTENLALALKSTTDALKVLTPELAPIDWASAHQVRASVLLHMPNASRLQRITRAMTSIEQAGAVYARHGMRREWAHTRATLATLLLNRPSGERADNVEHAIVASTEALTVLSATDDPMHWAQAQSDLAIGYFERSRGVRSENIEVGIAALRAALHVYTPQTSPFEWARAEGNLAGFFIVRERGHANENAARAVRGLRRSLQIFTKRSSPFEWAQGAMNLALALQRQEPTAGGGLDASIALLRETLGVLNKREHPLDWAMAKTNLANALRWRGEEGGQAWVRSAIVEYRDALKVFTIERAPNEHLRTSRLLGTALAGVEDWRAADGAFDNARRAAAMFIGEGLNAGERERVLSEIARLGPESAYVRWRLGDGLGAFERLEAGRAVEMTLKARLHDAALPAHERARSRRLLRASDLGELTLAGVAAARRRGELKRLERTRQALSQGAGHALDPPTLAAWLNDLTNEGGAVVAPVVTQSGALMLRAYRRGGALVIDGRLIDTSVGADAGRDTAAMGPSVRLDSLGAAGRWSNGAWRLYGAPLSDGAVGQRLVVLAPGDASPPGLAIGAEGPLIARYEVALAPNISAAARAQVRARRKATPSLGAIIDPRADLDGALVEHGFAAPLFDASRRELALRRGADAQSAPRALEGKSYWLIATHGRFDTVDPRRSTLALAQGQSLTLVDIAALANHSAPRLVVLSACESGVTHRSLRPEEFQGFASAFLQIGAAGVVAANWPVDDAASAFTIGRLLELHLKEGLAPSRALQQAQLWLRRANRNELIRVLHEQSSLMRAIERRAALRLCRRLKLECAVEAPFADPVHWAAYSLWGA